MFTVIGPPFNRTQRYLSKARSFVAKDMGRNSVRSYPR